MKTILDASFILNFLLPDEQSKQVVKTFRDYRMGKIQLIAPAILAFEVVNGLKYAVKAKRIDEQIAAKLLRAFTDLAITHLEVNLGGVLELSLQEDLSAYDASYVHLSKETGYPLLTLDRRLERLTK